MAEEGSGRLGDGLLVKGKGGLMCVMAWVRLEMSEEW